MAIYTNDRELDVLLGADYAQQDYKVTKLVAALERRAVLSTAHKKKMGRLLLGAAAVGVSKK